MKRLAISILLLSAASCQLSTLSAQDIYEEVKSIMDGYQKQKLDTTQNLEARKIATFKWDAIYYLLYQSGDMTEAQLGFQVSAMIDFVNLFIERMKDAKKAETKELVLSKFRNASLENARMGDTDKEVVYAYVDNKDFLTRFSLDTDWLKALEAVK